MNVRTVPHRNQILPRGRVGRLSSDYPGHEERLAAHERRIHDHPCPCGSGRRYVDCCIDRINQEQLELAHRRRMSRRRRIGA